MGPQGEEAITHWERALDGVSWTQAHSHIWAWLKGNTEEVAMWQTRPVEKDY